jgi:hypothetical protein
MPFNFDTFVNAGQFSDPANYSGFNGQMKSVEDVMKEAALASIMGPNGGGIAPPTNDMTVGESIMDFGKQAAKPLQQKFDQASNTYNKWNSSIKNTLGVAPLPTPQQQVQQQEQSTKWALPLPD